MKILSAEQIRAWDKYTMENEPIASIDLMERASIAFSEAFMKHFPAREDMETLIFCGPGNNGGDGLAVARILSGKGYTVSVFLVDDNKELSKDCEENLNRLKDQTQVKINIISDIQKLPKISKESIIIDAIFGTGINKKTEGIFAELIYAINNSEAKIVSIDIPSGLFTDTSNEANNAVIEAHYTFTFQLPKFSFFLCSNEKYLGKWQVLDIGLSKDFIERIETRHHFLDSEFIKSIYRQRKKCSHKGTYGHALIWAGAYGKIGAALLSSRAVLRAGAGLLTTYVPKCGYIILQIALPEAMCLTDKNELINTGIPGLETYTAIGIGPGLGTAPETKTAVKHILESAKMPLVIDADALNCISQENWQNLIPENSILTPHPKEFDRLAGDSATEFERLNKAADFAKTYKCILVLKGAYTSIHFPNGERYFNTTGNAGMATGGSGDVLTGIITGLLAQNYSAKDAALLAVYLHGLAGDFAASEKGEYSLIAGDIIDYLPKAFLKITE